MEDRRHITLSSKKFDYQTPEFFLDLVRKVGPIGLDPCTTRSNPTGARLFFYQQLDEDNCSISCGLADEWPALAPGEVCYDNPPYGAFLSGAAIEPDYEHFRDGELIGVGRGHAAKIACYDKAPTVVLVPARTETAWWRTLWDWSDCALLWSSPTYGPRINFIDPATGKEMKGSNLASTVFFGSAGDRAALYRFWEAFKDHGTLIEPFYDNWETA